MTKTAREKAFFDSIGGRALDQCFHAAFPGPLQRCGIMSGAARLNVSFLAMHTLLRRWAGLALTNGPRTGHRLPRIGQTVLLTPQKNGSGPFTIPVTFLRHA